MFYIQACNPINNGKHDDNDNKLMEAVETIFPMRTESAILVWNHICIPLSYKYDISYMIDDIIKLLRELVMKKEGKIKINWLPDTFCCQWNIKWTGDVLEIVSKWSCVVGDILEPLNCEPSITMNKWDFINEWKQVFCNIKIALHQCGYNENNLIDMNKFSGLYSLFTGQGILYQ